MGVTEQFFGGSTFCFPSCGEKTGVEAMADLICIGKKPVFGGTPTVYHIRRQFHHSTDFGWVVGDDVTWS